MVVVKEKITAADACRGMFPPSESQPFRLAEGSLFLKKSGGSKQYFLKARTPQQLQHRGCLDRIKMIDSAVNREGSEFFGHSQINKNAREVTMIDLMSIARTEHEGGDLFGQLSGLFEPADVKPKGYPDAVIWQGGKRRRKRQSRRPLADRRLRAARHHGGTDVLGLPFYVVPMWAQYRHDTSSSRSPGSATCPAPRSSGRPPATPT